MDVHEQVDDLLSNLSPLPGDRPRNTAAWKKTGVQIVEELRDLGHDPDVRAALNGCCIFAKAENALLADALDALMDLAVERAPAAAHCLGTAGLTDYLMSQIMAMLHLKNGDVRGAVDLLNAMSERLRLSHFAGNPATLASDGSVTIPPEGVNFEQSSDLRSFTASQRPEGKLGRPRKTPKPKGKPRPRITDEKILDTGTMSVAEWAAEHAKDLDMDDARQAKAAFARFDRAAYHRLNHRP